MTDVTDRRTMTAAAARDARARELNLDPGRMRALVRAWRAAQAAANAAQTAFLDARDALARIEGTWESYARGLPPRKRELAQVLIALEPDPEEHAKALDLVASRFPRGLADEIRERRAHLARLREEPEVHRQRAQDLGPLVEACREHARAHGFDFEDPSLGRYGPKAGAIGGAPAGARLSDRPTDLNLGG